MNTRIQTLFFASLILFGSIFLESCENGDLDLINKDSPFNIQLYSDSSFLKIEGDLFDPEVIWGNMDIYSLAYERMKQHLKVSDNHLNWDFNSGAELKISENIYEYVIYMWNSDNKKLESGKYRLEKLERFFLILPNERELITKNPAHQPRFERLLKGQHAMNIGACMRMFDYSLECPGVTLKAMCAEDASYLQPDGFGGIMIKGECDDPKTNLTVGYYFCDPVPFDSRSDLDAIITFNYRDDYNCRYDMALNRQHAPLITIRNRPYYTYHPEYIE